MPPTRRIAAVRKCRQQPSPFSSSFLAVDGSWPFSLAAVYKLLPQHITTRSGFLLSSTLFPYVCRPLFKLPSYIHPHTHLQRNKMRENTAQHQTATQSHTHSIWLSYPIYFWPPIYYIKSFFYILYIDLFSLSRVK